MPRTNTIGETISAHDEHEDCPRPAPVTTSDAERAAPTSSLPDWSECAMRVANSDFLAKRVAEGGYGPEHDSKLATELHRFIYEYDDADAYRSAWFLHRLEKLINEVKSQPDLPIDFKQATDQGGWQLVPKEPTPEMIAAMAVIECTATCINRFDDDTEEEVPILGMAGSEEAYAAMLAAASPYPDDIVVGPCICGSWPGGKCLKCPRIAAAPTLQGVADGDAVGGKSGEKL